MVKRRGREQHVDRRFPRVRYARAVQTNRLEFVVGSREGRRCVVGKIAEKAGEEKGAALLSFPPRVPALPLPY